MLTVRTGSSGIEQGAQQDGDENCRHVKNGWPATGTDTDSSLSFVSPETSVLFLLNPLNVALTVFTRLHTVVQFPDIVCQ